MADFSELFRTTEEQIEPLEAKIEGKLKCGKKLAYC